MATLRQESKILELVMEQSFNLLRPYPLMIEGKYDGRIRILGEVLKSITSHTASMLISSLYARDTDGSATILNQIGFYNALDKATTESAAISQDRTTEKVGA